MFLVVNDIKISRSVFFFFLSLFFALFFFTTSSQPIPICIKEKERENKSWLRIFYLKFRLEMTPSLLFYFSLLVYVLFVFWKWFKNRFFLLSCVKITGIKHSRKIVIILFYERRLSKNMFSTIKFCFLLRFFSP
jgi:hypothetical protein